MTFEEAWAALHAELALWPGWHLQEIHASSSSGTHHNGEWSGPERGWWYETNESSWCAVAVEDGWTPIERGHGPIEWSRPRFLHWASTPAEAMDGLRATLEERRLNPHLAHIYDCRFLPECADCVVDWKNCGWQEAEGALEREVVYAP